MKKLIIACIAAAMILSCSKNNVQPDEPEILLTAIYGDGKTETKFEYDNEARLIEVQFYNSAGTDITSKLKLEYNANGFINERTHYDMPGEIPTNKAVYTCDSEGRMIEVVNYNLEGPTPNSPNSSVVITNNAAGRPVKYVYRNDDDELTGQANINYFGDGNIKSIESYTTSGGGSLWLQQRVNLSVTNGFVPKGVQRIREVLGPDNLLSHFSESMQLFEYSQAGPVTYQMSISISARELNTDGSINRQTITSTRVIPAGNATVSSKNYDFITR